MQEIIKIKFRLRNIQTKVADPWELHFWVKNEGDKTEITKRLQKDFTLRLRDDWVVSANSTTFHGQNYWFMRGSNNYTEGNKKYYNKNSKQLFHKKIFNIELLEKYPDIKDKYYEGEFNTNENIMEIIKFCSICGKPADLLHSIHEGTGTDYSPDGTIYEPAWYCMEHMQGAIRKELKEMNGQSREEWQVRTDKSLDNSNRILALIKNALIKQFLFLNILLYILFTFIIPRFSWLLGLTLIIWFLLKYLIITKNPLYRYEFNINKLFKRKELAFAEVCAGAIIVQFIILLIILSSRFIFVPLWFKVLFWLPLPWFALIFEEEYKRNKSLIIKNI